MEKVREKIETNDLTLCGCGVSSGCPIKRGYPCSCTICHTKGEKKTPQNSCCGTDGNIGWGHGCPCYPIPTTKKIEKLERKITNIYPGTEIHIAYDPLVDKINQLIEAYNNEI